MQLKHKHRPHFAISQKSKSQKNVLNCSTGELLCFDGSTHDSLKKRDPGSINDIYYPKYKIKLNIKLNKINFKTFCENLCSFKQPASVFFCRVL